MTRILLTGAGFSKNWGGMLASEVFSYLLGASELDAHTRKMLIKANSLRGGFEDVLAALQGSSDPQDQARFATLTSVLVGMFNEMGLAFMQQQFEFAAQPDALRSLTPFLRRFDAIYTLNQDTLLEQKYVTFGGAGRATYIPGMRFINPSAFTGSPHDLIAPMEPNPSQFQLSASAQPYIKLHGSVNWVESNVGIRVLVMGGQKTVSIARFPILTWYHDEFRKALSQPGAKLMIMGYSFSDKHINDAIVEAIRTNDLKIFIVDPAGLQNLDQRGPPGAIPGPPCEFTETFLPQLIGVSTRPISTTFDNDTVENNTLMRFFG